MQGDVLAPAHPVQYSHGITDEPEGRMRGPLAESVRYGHVRPQFTSTAVMSAKLTLPS